MNSLINIESLEFKMSKNNCKVPVINGVHIHSIYNPQKESSTIINKYRETIEEKNVILLFGLGLGYHLDELKLKLEEIYQDNYKIMVIEPIKELVEEYEKLNLNKTSSVEIINELDIVKLYKNKDFLSFLIQKPSLIYHPASFNLFRKYYEAVVTYKAPVDIGSTLDEIMDESLRENMGEYPQDISMSEISKWIESKNNRKMNETDLLLLAFNEFYNY
jgi:hypothetical protein